MPGAPGGRAAPKTRGEGDFSLVDDRGSGWIKGDYLPPTGKGNGAFLRSFFLFFRRIEDQHPLSSSFPLIWATNAYSCRITADPSFLFFSGMWRIDEDPGSSFSSWAVTRRPEDIIIFSPPPFLLYQNQHEG